MLWPRNNFIQISFRHLDILNLLIHKKFRHEASWNVFVEFRFGNKMMPQSHADFKMFIIYSGRSMCEFCVRWHKYIFQCPVEFGHSIWILRSACTFIHSSVHWKILFPWKKDRVSQHQKTIKLEWLNISFSHLTSVWPSSNDYFHIFACVNELDRCKYFIAAYIKHVCALIQHTASNATSNNNKT